MRREVLEVKRFTVVSVWERGGDGVLHPSPTIFLEDVGLWLG